MRLTWPYACQRVLQCCNAPASMQVNLSVRVCERGYLRMCVCVHAYGWAAMKARRTLLRYEATYTVIAADDVATATLECHAHIYTYIYHIYSTAIQRLWAIWFGLIVCGAKQWLTDARTNGHTYMEFAVVAKCEVSFSLWLRVCVCVCVRP